MFTDEQINQLLQSLLNIQMELNIVIALLGIVFGGILASIVNRTWKQ